MIHLIIGCGLCVIFNIGIYIVIIKPIDSMLTHSKKRQVKALSLKRIKSKFRLVQKNTFLITVLLTLITMIIIIGFLVAQITVWLLFGDGKEIEITSDVALAMTVANGFICSCFYDRFKRQQNKWLLARHEEETKQESSDEQTDQ